MFTGSSFDATHNLFDTMLGAHGMFNDKEGANIMNDMDGGGNTARGSCGC
jgi:hypothetical protein